MGAALQQHHAVVPNHDAAHDTQAQAGAAQGGVATAVQSGKGFKYAFAIRYRNAGAVVFHRKVPVGVGFVAVQPNLTLRVADCVGDQIREGAFEVFWCGQDL